MGALPNGIDWADGATALPLGVDIAGAPILGGPTGTPTPAGAIATSSYDGSTVSIEEMPDSPEFERAEQCTVTHRFTMGYDEAMTRIGFYYRGRLVYDSAGNLYLVLSARVQRRKGNTAEMTIVTEAKSFDTPPDEYRCVPVDLGLNIIKHPRYFYSLIGTTAAEELVNQQVIRVLQDYMDDVNYARRTAIELLIAESLNQPTYTPGSTHAAFPDYYDKRTGKKASGLYITGTAMAKYAALEIIQKVWRGLSEPYIVGWELQWSSYHFIHPYLHPGGIIQEPLFEGQIPEYLWSTTFPPSGTLTYSPFSWMAWYNPQCYSSDGTRSGSTVISWLRKADEVYRERTWFKKTRTWWGTVVGHWDAELCTVQNRPQSVWDYKPFNTYNAA